ncbi:MAG: MerR family transcriptional regulator [Deltaproteobacteria bacterium]|nr:MerR family transcriptional regulator [Deltaproteobacteria bacterium]
MKIQELSKKSKLSKDTIRFYEKIGILSKPSRDNSGYRKYDHHFLKQLNMIAKAKELGFSLDEIKELSDLLYSKSLTKKKMARQLEIKLQEIVYKMKALNKIKKEIQKALDGLCEYKDVLD